MITNAISSVSKLSGGAPSPAVSVSAMSSGSWKVLKVVAPGHGSYSLATVKYIILKVVICMFGPQKVNYIIFQKEKHGYICVK